MHAVWACHYTFTEIISVINIVDVNGLVSMNVLDALAAFMMITHANSETPITVVNYAVHAWLRSYMWN